MIYFPSLVSLANASFIMEESFFMGQSVGKCRIFWAWQAVECEECYNLHDGVNHALLSLCSFISCRQFR